MMTGRDRGFDVKKTRNAHELHTKFLNTRLSLLTHSSNALTPELALLLLQYQTNRQHASIHYYR